MATHVERNGDTVQLNIDTLGDGTHWEVHAFSLKPTSVNQDDPEAPLETAEQAEARVKKGMRAAIDAAQEVRLRTLAPRAVRPESLDAWLGRDRARGVKQAEAGAEEATDA